MISLRTPRKTHKKSGVTIQPISQKSAQESTESVKNSQGRAKRSLLQSEESKTSVIIPVDSQGDWATEVYTQPRRATLARLNSKHVLQSSPRITPPMTKEEMAEIRKANSDLQEKLDELALLLKS